MRTRACEGSSHAQQLPLYDIWLKKQGNKAQLYNGLLLFVVKNNKLHFFKKIDMATWYFSFFSSLLFMEGGREGNLAGKKRYLNIFFFEIMTSSCSIFFFKLWHQLTFRHWKGGKTAKSWIVGSLVSHITALKWEN